MDYRLEVNLYFNSWLRTDKNSNFLCGQDRPTTLIAYYMKGIVIYSLVFL